MVRSTQTSLRIRPTISLEICPISLISKEKGYKESVTKEIIIKINALLNSGGGALEMLYESSPCRKEIDASVRILEQKIGNLVGTVFLTSNIAFQLLTQKIVIHVKQVEAPYVVNYNLYLPTKSQVKVIPPTESIAKVKEVINRPNKPVKVPFALNSCHRNFVKNGTATCDEDTNVQWKSLKSGFSTNVTLADRITSKSNKLPCYISAFANHCGGHIYYGINDDGVVEGENVTENDETEITKKVAKTMEKMIWLGRYPLLPQRGRHWDVFFVAVKDNQDKPIPLTFVIVVAIAPCRGGVFTDIPESYQIVDEKVEKKGVAYWQNFFCGISYEQTDPIPSTIPVSPWSSTKNRKIYQLLTTKLVQYRNDKEMNKFSLLCDMAVAKYPDSCAGLIATAEKAAIACKNNLFEKARILMHKYFDALNQASVNDASFLEVRGLCIKSRTERAEGNYEESYKTAKDGLEKLQLLPPDFLSVWFYIHAAAVATILSTKENIPERHDSLVKESRTYLEASLRDADTLDEQKFPRNTADLKQKSRVYLAISHLGCSTSGATVRQANVRKVDIDKAVSQLKAVRNSNLDGIKPTRFQEVEWYLAQSDLCYRRSEMSSSSDKQIEELRWAFELSKKAQCLAQELHFEEAVQYASRRLARLTEILVRNAFRPCSKRPLAKEMEDLLSLSEEF